MRFLFAIQNLNGEKWLHQSLSSVVGQVRIAQAMGHEARAVMVDAGSTDESIEMADAMGVRSFSHLRLNQAGALNLLLTEFNGAYDYFNCVNNDDYLLPAFLPEHLKTLASNPGADLLHGTCMFFDEQNKSVYKHNGITWEQGFKERVNRLAHPTFLISKACFDKYGTFDDSLKHAYDFEYTARVYAKGGRIAFTDAPVAAYRWREGQGTKLYPAEIIPEHKAVCERWLK